MVLQFLDSFHPQILDKYYIIQVCIMRQSINSIDECEQDNVEGVFFADHQVFIMPLQLLLVMAAFTCRNPFGRCSLFNQVNKSKHVIAASAFRWWISDTTKKARETTTGERILFNATILSEYCSMNAYSSINESKIKFGTTAVAVKCLLYPVTASHSTGY